MDCFEHYSLVGLGEYHWDKVGTDFCQSLLAGDAETYRDPAYLEELRRRNRIMVQGGQPDRAEEIEKAFADTRAAGDGG